MELLPEQQLAVGMLFLPQNTAVATKEMLRFMQCVCSQGLHWLGWRDVPVSCDVLGELALASLPVIRQALITRSRRRQLEPGRDGAPSVSGPKGV